MKDLYQDEKTPYEILSININASPREIHLALGEYLKERKNPQLGMRAAALLRSTKERLEYDLFSYSDRFEDLNPEKFQNNFEFDGSLPVPVEDKIITDLDLVDSFDEITPIEFNQIDFIDVKIPIGSGEWMPWEFDR